MMVLGAVRVRACPESARRPSGAMVGAITEPGFGAAGDVRRTLPQTGRPVRDSQIPRIGIWRPHRDSERIDTELLMPFSGEVVLTSRWRRAA
jgi:hypothetical protein